MKSMKMVKKAQAGFTLIELMIVVAIIGILAAVAIPAYQDYVIKAKISNALGSVGSIKTAIAMCAQETGVAVDAALTGCSADSNGVPAFTPTKEVSGATITDGVIVMTLANIGSAVDGKKITMTPTVKADSLKWVNTTDITSGTAAYTAVTKNNAGS